MDSIVAVIVVVVIITITVTIIIITSGKETKSLVDAAAEKVMPIEGV